ncbi:BtpA/SgcQ family protein [Patescibacteria group bacterium]|nr:BtpA/SgcQ family protein [Patescibacteria group bacterium]
MFQKVFQLKNNIVIGMIHFPPLLGYLNFIGIDKSLQFALEDLRNLEKGDVDAIMVENNYDVPHKEFVSPEVIASMTYLTTKIIDATILPVGVSVLWNDFRTALIIAKVCGGKFIRVPVFVDNVKTNYGEFYANPQDVVNYRKSIHAEEVMLFTDIHVKHATIISPYTIQESANKAIKMGSDAIVITGKWTGDAPSTEDLENVRKTVGNFPILVGSGTSKENAKYINKVANGVIVSTSLKVGTSKTGEVNVKGYEQRISRQKVTEFVREFKSK